MRKASFEVIVGSFTKHNAVYHAAITAPVNVAEAPLAIDYKILLSHPQQKTISFKLRLDEHGRWIPDKKRQVDPWIADHIGAIIEEKVLKKKF